MNLSAEESAMLAGEEGPGVQKAMEIVVALGQIYGAADLVPVASVQVSGVSYKNLGDAGLDFLEEWAAQGAKARVPAMLNPAGMDLAVWQISYDPTGTGEVTAAMGDFNQEMVEAGVMLSGEGLHPSSRGARVHISEGKGTVTDGPFAQTKELIAGFWLVDVASMHEAIEWAKRVPDPMGEGKEAEIEIRRVFEAEDFPPDVFTPEEAAREEALRARLKHAAQP